MHKRRRIEEPHESRTVDVNSPPSPLAIAELIEMVGLCLDRRSLTRCLRVCRQWYQVLCCQVWEDIKKYTAGCSLPDGKTSSGPSLVLLNTHADLVRKLYVKVYRGSTPFPYRDCYCPWLTELTVVKLKGHRSGSEKLFEESLTSYVCKHRGTLKKLALQVNQSKALTQAMVTCSNMESLMTQAPYLGEGEELEEWMQWYELQGSRLKKLTLTWDTSSRVNNDFIMDKTMDALLSKTSTSSLRILELRANGPTLASLQGQMLLVMKSPGLKHLSWSIVDSKSAIARLAEAFEKSSHGPFCQQLESISFPDYGTFFPKDFQRVMESLPALTDLMMTGGYLMSSESTLTYLKTLIRLRKLSIDGCRWATPDVVQDILCSLPNLEVFKANYLSDVAIQKDPRRWVCRGLRELTVGLVVLTGPNPSLAAVQAMMMVSLCQLERLERLKIPKTVKFSALLGVESEPLRFRMEDGLDKLKTLKRLQTFEVPKGRWWGKDEAQFALENWTQLRELDIDMDYKAERILGHRLMKSVAVDESFVF